jgi:hypothetical protein
MASTGDGRTAPASDPYGGKGHPRSRADPNGQAEPTASDEAEVAAPLGLAPLCKRALAV